MNKLLRLVDNFIFLEGPRWYQDKLYVSDMWGKKVYSIDSTGQSTELVEIVNRPSGIGFMRNGTMVLSSMADKKVLGLNSARLPVCRRRRFRSYLYES